MFDVVTFKDFVRIEPQNFINGTVGAVEMELNRRLANKVMLQTGLGICVWDILDIGDCEIYPSDGAFYAEVQFRFVIFKPFINEIIVGTINKCSIEGIQITLEFFDDIIIPPQNIPQPSKFDSDKNRWIWIYKVEDQEDDIPIESQDKITFKVVDYIWKDNFPVTSNSANDNRTQQEQSMAPFTVIGTIIGTGLGLPIWWESADE